MNPFNPNHAAFASSTGWIYFTSGIIRNASPEMLMKFRITPPDNQQKSGSSTQQNVSAIKQIIYSPAERDIIFLVLHKEIIIFDLNVNLVCKLLIYLSLHIIIILFFYRLLVQLILIEEGLHFLNYN